MTTVNEFAIGPTLTQQVVLGGDKFLTPFRVVASPTIRPALAVRTWHNVFGVQNRQVMQADWDTIQPEEVAAALAIQMEEVKELVRSLGFPDFDVTFGEQQPPEAGYDMTEVLDGIGDVLFTTYGLADRLGLPADQALTEITVSNMSKMGADGHPIQNGITLGYQEGEPGYKADAPIGKVLKGPNYEPPRLGHLINLLRVDK